MVTMQTKERAIQDHRRCAYAMSLVSVFLSSLALVAWEVTFASFAAGYLLVALWHLRRARRIERSQLPIARLLMLGLVVALISGCGLVDAADGETDNAADCCWLWPSDGAVASCVRDSVPDLSVYEHDENGCIVVTCHPTLIGAEVTVCPDDASDP